MELILKSVLAYLATSIDFFALLLVFFASFPHRSHRAFSVGHTLGIVTLLVFCAFMSLALNQWTEIQPFLGWLGFLPIALGVLSFFRKESDLENDMLKSSALPFVLGFTLTVAVCSSDNVAVYVPIFTTMSPMEISIVSWISLGLTVLVVWGTHALATQTWIGAWIHRLERTIIPLVLLFIGVWILFDSQVLSFGI